MAASSMKGFENLEIQLEEIKSATNNFSEENVIGHGGFGKVYKGELSHSHFEGKSVALKRLDRRYGQGDSEFYKEVRMLSCYKHDNIISLLGFSSGRAEMILVYEYASRGSLDSYLKDVNLTWTRRLKICLDAAKGLSYLHDPRETSQRLIHCDIKSANILLDENFKAKVSDFGLSKLGPANQQNSILVTGASGTPGYIDPVYMETYTLVKESDVYSFGVVLFEVLCGKLCVEYNTKGQLKVIHVPMWKQSYKDNKLDEIILQDLRQQMDPISLKTFSDIAFQCLRKAREKRPTMSCVVKELEIALDSQEFTDLRLKMLTKYENILLAVDPLLIYKTGNQLKEILSKGLTINDGKKRLFVTEKGEHFERIYIEACLNPAKINRLIQVSGDIVNSRFPGGLCYKYYWEKFIACVRGEYLTPHISYTLNLVFRVKYQSHVNSYNPLRYKLDGEQKVFIIYPSYMREDGWFTTPLHHFTSQGKTAYLQFEFDYNYSINTLLIAGIEFQPSEEKVELQVFEEYQDIVEVTSQSLFYTSIDELKQILSKGVFLNGYKTWFSLNKKGEYCHLISIRDCLIPNEDFPSRYESHYKSRFPTGYYLTDKKGFETHVKTQFLSPLITYTVNLVFYSSSPSKQVYVGLKYRLKGETTTSAVYLLYHMADLFHMVELYQFTSDGSFVDLEIEFDDHETNLRVEGILFQPLEIEEDSEIDSESDSEQKILNDYEEILNLSKDSLMWTTKKELYSILRRGFLLDNCQQWFTVDKLGKKCLMLSARATCVIDDYKSAWESCQESRFGEVLVIMASHKFAIDGKIKSEVVSLETEYAVYIVYKLPQDQSTFEAPLFVQEKGCSKDTGWGIYLVSPPVTPCIGSKLDENIYKPLNRYERDDIPRQRSDGWMEVEVWTFKTTTKPISLHLQFEHPYKEDLSGLRVQGIELRPN